MNKPIPSTEHPVRIRVKKTLENFRRKRVPGPDPVTGKFSFTIDITATTQDAYIPVSIASGKKPTGFIYQIEGTAEGGISTTDISCRGDGITQITLGTINYCKIPVGMTATFRIFVETQGKVGKSYRIVIYQMNYKLSPTDARYQKLPLDIHTRMLKFD